MKRLTEEQVQLYVTKRYITQEEARMILATPQDPGSLTFGLPKENI